MAMKTIGFILLLSLVANVSSTVTAVTLDVTPSASRYSTGFNVSATVTKTLTFDVTRGSYVKLMRQDLFKEVQKTSTGQIEGRPRLGKQKPSVQAPDTWIHVVLKAGAKGELSATLAMRADNLYTVGFQAHDGAWFGFKDTAHLLPSAKEMSFRSDYAGLTGGKGYAEMVQVAVGKSAMEQAAMTLAQYKVGGAIPEDEVRKALATMVLTISEGQRFVVVQNNVTAVWGEGGQVSQTGVDLLVRWRDISCALIGWEKTKKNWSKIPEAAKIKNLGNPAMKDAKAAAANIYFVLSATTCDTTSA